MVAALTSQTPDVDATPELVRLLLEHPLDWREAIERAAPHDPYAPDYLEACLWTAVRRREHRERLALAQEPASEPAPRAMPAVTVRPMANPRPLTLGEVVSGMRAMAQAGLMAALRRRRR
ncbi:MAG: hypothetical protein CVU47_12435 [Chloroflexi bacterium HGW-Chloroflexi-9]|nr:MAG: hypothetical protein CVU47_12435 [Chloroflexi bacterium HGW-Chloroflexi-9]